ncbi:hypothetical protein ILUMI_19230 [Ignelater luminosus]|uniref:HMG box domain-containing protein n=1 Tax=Ignelater luminosus TaxID=2038154 RepID=A0A8K0CGK0_IGNLU|nr:hypothetical protein ILUMI_19230 [Ignelater luminosus]
MGAISTRSSSSSSIKMKRNCCFANDNTKKNDKACVPSNKDTKKCYKAGKITRNPFFNFLREYRSKNCGMTVIALAKAAGAIWRKMDATQREPYCKLAQSAPKTPRCRRRHKNHQKKKNKCGKRR